MRPGEGSAHMRVLIAHNRYQFAGGEEAVVRDEIELLRGMGHEVAEYTRDNKELPDMGALSAGAQALWSRRTVSEVGAMLGSFRPDILHVHNTFPLISPSIFWSGQTGSHSPAVVQTLHNFRLVCIEPLLMRGGEVCEQCVGKVPWRGVVHRCYRQSLAQSLVAAGALQLHRGLGTYRSRVHRFIALTDFAKEKFVSAGFEARKVIVKPNFVAPDPGPAYRGPRSRGIFVGRLSREKGLEVLAGAVASSKLPPVDVVGAGPDQDRLQLHPTLRLLGWKPPEAVRDLIRHASYLVIPSICYEGLPRALLEAYALGVPVIASRLGPLRELVKDGDTGLLFEPGSIADLARRLSWAEQHPEQIRHMGESARKLYLRSYTPEQNYKRLLSIYGEAAHEARRTCEAASGDAPRPR